MFIRLYKNFLTPEYCNKLIEEFDSSLATHTKTESADFDEVNIVGAEWDSVHNLIGKFAELVEIYINSVGIVDSIQWPYETEWEQFRLKRYKQSNQQFKLHTDDAGGRLLAFFVYLNDVEEGGETVFPLHKASITPTQGSALVFPTTWEYLHEGKTPISNDKYILGGYLRGQHGE